MTVASFPSNETERLARLHELVVLDSGPEPLFDSIARMASEVCGVPIALITLLDADRQWFKATVGLDSITETPRAVAFCAHTILDDELLSVPDMTRDARFADNPFVTGEQHVRFYAGAPLVLPGGERVGTLCVIDRESRQLDDAQMRTLKSLAAMATQALAMRAELLRKALSARSDYEKTLADAAAESQDLYCNAPCGYHSLDADGRFVRINDTALRWLGLAREDVVGKRFMKDFLTPEGCALFAQGFPRLKKDGSLTGIEFDLVGRDGITRRLISSASVVRDAAGAFVMTRTVTYDITELQVTRDELRRANEHQQAIIDTDLVGIVKLRHRRIAWASKGAERMFGCEPGAMVGLSTRTFHPDDASFETQNRLDSAKLQVGEVHRAQLRLARKDGVPLWVDVSATVLPSEPEDPLVLLVDISAQKRAEELRLQGQLLEAENRQLVEANRLRGLFLANMSHELYTPLNAVIGYAHVLQSGAIAPGSPKFAKYLGDIGTSGQHLLGSIQTILNFTDAESGRIDLKAEAVALPEVLRNVIDAAELAAGRRLVRTHLRFDDSLGAVVIDKLRFAQVVSHLLSNAIKFSHEDGRVEVRVSADGDERFRIEVADQGIGIAEADLPRLFTAFRQLSEGNAKSHQGTGLSLALARRLVEAQGGTIDVVSRPDEGSVFGFTLPRG